MSSTKKSKLLFVSKSDRGEVLVEAVPDSFIRSAKGVWRKGTVGAVELAERFERITDSAVATKLFHEASAAVKSA